MLQIFYQTNTKSSQNYFQHYGTTNSLLIISFTLSYHQLAHILLGGTREIRLVLCDSWWNHRGILGEWIKIFNKFFRIFFHRFWNLLFIYANDSSHKKS